MQTYNINEKLYQETLRSETSQSFILSGITSWKNPPLNSLQDINNEIFALEGDQDGIVFRPKGTVDLHNPEKQGITKGIIQFLKEKMIALDEKFQLYKSNQTLRGFEIPTEPPPDLLDQMTITTAKLKCRHLEVEKLQKMKAEKEKQLETERYSNMLKNGLQCRSTAEIPIKSIDGQQCSVIAGLPYISDSLSPYKGMLVSDYRKLAAEWQKTRKNDNMSFARSVAKEELPPIPDWAKKNMKKL